MCGIAGYFGPRPPGPGLVENTLNAMHRRGPDAQDAVNLDLGANQLTLLHTRLSIIDLDPRATQPFKSDGLTLIFNGEIYNYLELRKELEKKGENFRTKSDTEVLIKAYKNWGCACFSRLEGMFALALFDQKAGVLTLARDAFGEKPLYTAFDGQGLYFGSQIKFLHAMGLPAGPVNMARLERFLASGYRVIFKQMDSAFENIKTFPAARYAQLELPKEPQTKPYWKLQYKPEKMSLSEAEEGARYYFRQSLKKRLRADVPIALTLSGGIDSNVLAASAIKDFGCDMQAFSMVGEEEDYNEEYYARKAAENLGCPLHVKYIRHENFIRRLERMTRHFDAPLSSIGMYLDGYLAESVQQAGYKVAMNGIGSDEIFTGYYDHYLYWLAGQIGADDFASKQKDWENSHGKWVKNRFFKNPLRFVETPNSREYLFHNMPEINRFLKHPVDAAKIEKHYCEDSLRNRMLNEILDEAVPVYMHDVDLNWMYQSIESRTPYLDKSLAEFLFTVPSEFLIQQGYSKYLLRRIGAGLVDPDILYLKRKTGFNASMRHLLDLNSEDTRAFFLNPGPIYDLIERREIEQLLSDPRRQAGCDNFLFCFAAVQMFLQRNI